MFSIKKKFFSKKHIGGKLVKGAKIKLPEINNAAAGLIQAALAFLYLVGLVETLTALGTATETREPVLQSLTAVTAPLFFFGLIVLSFLWMFAVFFSYPIMLLSQSKAKKAIEVFAYTFFWFLIIMILFMALALLK